MAMRLGSSGGGGNGGSRPRAAGVRSVYEDFKPMSEWKHEEGADILHLHLPGFIKEQIRIIAESSRGILRVRGDRLVAGNKWSRFQEEIQVPEDCNMQEIHAKFEKGILRITMPKKFLPEKPRSQPTKKPNGPQQPPPQSPPKKPSQSVLAPTGPVPPLPPIISPLDRAKFPNSQEESSRREKKETNEKRREDDVAEKVKETREKLRDWIMAPQRVGNDQEAALDKPAIDAISGKQREAKLEAKEKSKDLTMATDEVGRKTVIMGNMEEERGKREVEDGGEEKLGSKESLSDEGVKGKKSLNLRSLNDERRLLVNVGVAVLVIIALVAYISYSFGSSSES